MVPYVPFPPRTARAPDVDASALRRARERVDPNSHFCYYIFDEDRVAHLPPRLGSRGCSRGPCWPRALPGGSAEIRGGRKGRSAAYRLSAEAQSDSGPIGRDPWHERIRGKPTRERRACPELHDRGTCCGALQRRHLAGLYRAPIRCNAASPGDGRSLGRIATGCARRYSLRRVHSRPKILPSRSRQVDVCGRNRRRFIDEDVEQHDKSRLRLVVKYSVAQTAAIAL